MPPDSPCTISVFQALAEALTTSKDMVGRRLWAECDPWATNLGTWAKGKCDDVVRELKLATTTAQNALSDVTIKFTELGNDIQCALPLQPKGLAVLIASRAALATAATHAPRALITPACPPCRELFDKVQILVGNVARFATELAAKLKITIESLPTIDDMVVKARKMAEDWLNDILCLRPSIGSGINSGNPMVVIGPANENPALADSDSLLVGVSRLNIATVSPITTGTTRTYRCSTEVACARACACGCMCACMSFAGDHVSQIVLRGLRLCARLKWLGRSDERLLGEQHGCRGLGQLVHSGHVHLLQLLGRSKPGIGRPGRHAWFP